MNLRQQLESANRILRLTAGLLTMDTLSEELYRLRRVRQELVTSWTNETPIDVLASGETYVRLDYMVRHYFWARFGPNSIATFGKPTEGSLDEALSINLEWTKFDMPEAGCVMALMTGPKFQTPNDELWLIDWSDVNMWTLWDPALGNPRRHLVITNVKKFDYQ